MLAFVFICEILLVVDVLSLFESLYQSFATSFSHNLLQFYCVVANLLPVLGGTMTTLGAIVCEEALLVCVGLFSYFAVGITLLSQTFFGSLQFGGDCVSSVFI